MHSHVRSIGTWDDVGYRSTGSRTRPLALASKSETKLCWWIVTQFGDGRRRAVAYFDESVLRCP